MNEELMWWLGIVAVFFGFSCDIWWVEIPCGVAIYIGMILMFCEIGKPYRRPR
jgi:hypothetical protein